MTESQEKDKPLPQNKEEFAKRLRGLYECDLYVPSEEAKTLAKNPTLLNALVSDMDTRIKKDRPVKLSVFFTALSAYLKDPMNLFQKGESGVGKSYDTVQSLVYFPTETVILLGGISPKALIHDHGILMTKEGKPIDEDNIPEKPRRMDFDSLDEYRDASANYKRKLKEYKDALKGSYTLIDLSSKVLVFLETPEFEAFRMLYPVLSHDTERYEYRFVDKSGKGSMRTVHVILEGWPATIFLMVERRFMEELATRSFTVTPENTPDKIEAANELTNIKSCYPWMQENTNKTAENFKEILKAIQTWFKVYNADVVIPFTELSKLFPREIARDMRDYSHFTQFVKTVTALHLFQRPVLKLKDQRFLVATIYDVAVALSIYAEIFESTRTGTDQALLNFYHDVLCKRKQWTIKEATDAYNQSAAKKASGETIRVKLERLAQIGYVDIQKSDTDKRMNSYTPLVEENREIPKISQEINVWAVLGSKLKNGCETWVKNVLADPDLKIAKNNFDIETPLAASELSSMIWEQKNISSLQEDFVCRFLQRKNEPKQPKNPKTEQTEESCQVLDKTKLDSYGVAQDKGDTVTQKPKVSEVNIESKESKREYTQKTNLVLTIRRTKNAEKCFYCEQKASEYECEDNTGKFYNCESCLKATTLPAYKKQGYEIKVESPKPEENA